MRVYLAGPPYADEYRRRAARLLAAAGLEAVDPMRRDFRGRTKGREREIVQGDLADIVACQAVLASFAHPDEGTAMEAWYAHSLGKPVVAYTGGTPPHPWTVYVADAVCSDLEEAVEAVARACTLPGSAAVTRFLHTMYRITDPERSRGFYEALGFRFSRSMDIVREGRLEATNYFFSLGDQENVLELTYNHDGRTYDLGTGYGHIALAVDDLDATLERLRAQGIEPERPPYRVREGGARLCFVRDPDGYRIELIDQSGR